MLPDGMKADEVALDLMAPRAPLGRSLARAERSSPSSIDAGDDRCAGDGAVGADGMVRLFPQGRSAFDEAHRLPRPAMMNARCVAMGGGVGAPPLLCSRVAPAWLFHASSEAN